MIKDMLKKGLNLITGCRSGRTSCRGIKPGVFKCNEYLVALYRIKDWSINIHELTYLDYVYNLKKFLDVFNTEFCQTIFYTDIQPVDVNKYLSKLNHMMQMKLVELELDKANTRLRSYIEKLLDIRKRVLMGIKPVKSSNIIAMICSNRVDSDNINNVAYKAKNVLDIDLEPLLETHYAEIFLNFRSP
ncbi:MAG: hypothetical protein QW101_01840 [Ignisphaera sp.]|uniref:Uncharacterized protein n=1 Tax=Ignisphaera aggregans TaxID=334771 RepID=A0A7J3MZ84_9CREN